MKFKPEWVDAELEVNSNQNETVSNDSKSPDTNDVAEKLQQVKTDDTVATITPTQAAD